MTIDGWSVQDDGFRLNIEPDVCNWDRRGRSEEPSSRNLAMMTAAPKLLEACEAAYAYIGDDVALHSKLYDAINLATNSE